jgi:uroporphyrin-III C-methyltransferase
MIGKVYIVGAGPGDPDLLTIKAVKAIKKADVILYDRLINPEILSYAKKNCEMIYVGKADGKHTMEQDKINALLYFYSKKYPNVVRLKGGDPFVFGRGGEEAIYLAERDVPFEIIPGITSSISAPAYSGIPVTHRGVAASFAVITGHEAPNKKKSVDWESLKGIDTLIFLMGVTNRQEIAKKLIEIGRNPEEPVAFIEKGTTEEHKVIESTLKEVAKNPPEVTPPAVFVIGEVVKLRNKIKWFEKDLIPINYLV